MVNSGCKCVDGNCWRQFKFDEVKEFLDQFERRGKTEQDAILFLAAGEFGGDHQTKRSRNEYSFLGRFVRRACFEAILGISSHRIDRLGCLDLRYGKRIAKPSPLLASIDSFCMILYNSIAEPLPTKRLNKQLDTVTFCCLPWFFGILVLVIMTLISLLFLLR